VVLKEEPVLKFIKEKGYYFMSSISNTKGWHQQMCESAVSTTVSAASIAGALAPAMHPLRKKSFEQTGTGKPASVLESLAVWRRAAPVLSGTLCSQVVAESAIKKRIAPDFDTMSPEKKVAVSAVSAVAVGALTSPLLAVFNGLTMGKAPAIPTSKELRWTTVREGLFVAGLTGSGPVGEWAKKRWGGEDERVNTAVEYGVTALAAGTASVLSHPFDTILSANQAGVPIRHRMAGWRPRAIGVVGLAVGYKALNGVLQPWGSRAVNQLYPVQETAK
jgi:hypothetical protein